MTFAAIQAVYDSYVGLPASQKAVLLALAYHVNKDTGHAWPSVRTMALETGLSTRTVQRSLPLLLTSGAISVVKQWTPTSPTVYRVEPREGGGDTLTTDTVSGGDIEEGIGVTPSAQPPDTVTPKPQRTAREPQSGEEFQRMHPEVWEEALARTDGRPDIQNRNAYAMKVATGLLAGRGRITPVPPKSARESLPDCDVCDNHRWIFEKGDDGHEVTVPCVCRLATANT